MIIDLLDKLERIQPFSEAKAWTLFKVAAISEAAGWSLLIGGILFKHFITPANNAPVLIAGQIHGMIFLTYIAAVVVLYSSLRWSRKRTIVAGLASVPPYGSLLFEQWAAYKRRSEALKTYREITVRAIIVQRAELLVIQPKDSGYWNLPGGLVKSDETVEFALERMVAEQLGVKPTIGRLAYVVQDHHVSTQQLEMFFIVSNASDFKTAALKETIKASPLIDEIRYLKPKGNPDLRPLFLQTEPVIAAAKQPRGPAIFI